MNKTCIDTDDDDFEFEDAKEEEEDDIYRNDTTAFMISRQNASRFINETMNRNTNLPNEKKAPIPNKILDSMLLKYSDVEDDFEEENNKLAALKAKT